MSSWRDYIDIESACQKYQLIAKKGISGQVYNVGSGKSLQMRSLLNTILDDAGLDKSIIKENIFLKSHKESNIIYADISKTNQLMINE